MPRNGLGIASLVLGILAIPAAISGPGGVILGTVGLILGIVAINRARRGVATNRGVATAGTVLSVIGLLLGILVTVLWAVFINRYWECLDPDNPMTRSERQACFDRIDQGLAPTTSIGQASTVPSTMPARAA